MIAALKLVPAWAWTTLGLILAMSLGFGCQTVRLAEVRADYAKYRGDVAIAAGEASERARQTEQKRQRDIDQVHYDAAQQKRKDDALAAQQRADNDSLREQTRELLADRASLNARLAKRGKTINDLVDLLAELRSEADGYAGELAAALTASRWAGFACEASYSAIAKLP